MVIEWFSHGFHKHNGFRNGFHKNTYISSIDTNGFHKNVLVFEWFSNGLPQNTYISLWRRPAAGGRRAAGHGRPFRPSLRNSLVGVETVACLSVQVGE